MYSNVLTFSITKDRIKIAQKLAPTVTFLDPCHSSQMLLIASTRNVRAAYRLLFASLTRFDL